MWLRHLLLMVGMFLVAAQDGTFTRTDTNSGTATKYQVPPNEIQTGVDSGSSQPRPTSFNSVQPDQRQGEIRTGAGSDSSQPRPTSFNNVQPDQRQGEIRTGAGSDSSQPRLTSFNNVHLDQRQGEIRTGAGSGSSQPRLTSYNLVKPQERPGEIRTGVSSVTSQYPSDSSQARLTSYNRVQSDHHPGEVRPGVGSNISQYRPDISQYPPTSYNRLQPNYRPRPSKETTHRPLTQSFQAMSYVHDDLPFIIFNTDPRTNKREFPLNNEIRQTATVTVRPNPNAHAYYDEFDKRLLLNKLEERMKIFYDNNPILMPVFRDMEKEAKDRQKQHKLFNFFKTQRSNV